MENIRSLVIAPKPFTAYFNVHLDSPEKFVPPLVPLLVIIVRLSCVKTSRTKFEFDLVCHD